MHVGLEIRIQDIAVKGSSKSGFGELVGKAGVTAFLMVALKEVIRFAAIADEELLGVVVREGNGRASELVLDEDVVNKAAVEFDKIFASGLSGKGVAEDTAGGKGGMTEGNQMEEGLVAVSTVDNSRIPRVLGGNTAFLAEVLANQTGPCFQRGFVKAGKDISIGGTKGKEACRIRLGDKMLVGHDIDTTIQSTSKELGVEAANGSRVTGGEGGSCITECLGIQVGLENGAVGDDATFAKTWMPEVEAVPVGGGTKSVNHLIGKRVLDDRGRKLLVFVESGIAVKNGSRENPGIEGGMIANTSDRVLVRGIQAKVVVRIESGTRGGRDGR